MRSPVALLIFMLVLAGVLGFYLLKRETAPLLPEETVAVPEAVPEAADAAVGARSATPLPGAAMDEEEASVGETQPPSAEVASLPPGYPESNVPHRVVRAWGRRDDGSPKRVVGMSILVNPATSDAELTELAEDVLGANCDASMMSVRIYDSEVAFDPEKYAAHDPIIAEHTIGQIWVNPDDNPYRPKLRVKIRGRDVLVGAEAMPTGEACRPAS